MVCTGREKGHPEFRFYDRDWRRLKYLKPELEPDGEISRPSNFNEIIRISELLSKETPHLRVDLYDISGNIYFGELTLFNQSGFDTEISKDTDKRWGNQIDLSLVRRKF